MPCYPQKKPGGPLNCSPFTPALFLLMVLDARRCVGLSCNTHLLENTRVERLSFSDLLVNPEHNVRHSCDSRLSDGVVREYAHGWSIRSHLSVWLTYTWGSVIIEEAFGASSSRASHAGQQAVVIGFGVPTASQGYPKHQMKCILAALLTYTLIFGFLTCQRRQDDLVASYQLTSSSETVPSQACNTSTRE